MTKKFSTDNARLGGLPAELDRWMQVGKPDETLTVIYRLPGFANPRTIAEALTKAGVKTETVGKTAIVGSVAQKDLKRTLEVKGVLGVEMPTRLSMKATPTLGLKAKRGKLSDADFNLDPSSSRQRKL